METLDVGSGDSGWRGVEEGGCAHLIVGHPLGLGDELGAAHPAVGVCEQVLVQLWRPHLDRGHKRSGDSRKHR